MKVTMVKRGVAVDEALRSFVQDKVETSLGRLEHDVRSVRVQLQDTNGPRGGLDKRCVVTVTGDRFRPLVVDTRDVALRAAVAQALHIASRMVVRALQRERDAAATAALRFGRGVPAFGGR
jgi:hypothetical protein